MRRTLVLSLLLLAGCGSPEAQSPTPPPVTPEPTPVEPTPVATGAAQATPEAPPPTAPTPETPPVVAEVPPTPPTADGPEVDLLHAVVTRVAVSSAYRDDSAQVSRLVDGDVETAWNSRSGDLVGAFIEVDVPPEASVRAIAMTTGFTHTTARADLFTGNHRVSRVRLSRDGAALGEHTLDTSGRGLVEIPVSQPGGRFRIEVLETLPGERSDWRELCVSELRVLGTAPGARPASASPATSVGALTGSIEEAEAAEEAAEEAEDAAAIAALELEAYEEDLEDWPVYVIGLSPAAEGEDYLSNAVVRQARVRLDTERRRVLQETASHIETSAPAGAAALRARATNFGGLWSDRHLDLDALLSAGDALWPEARRCHAATLAARIRVQTVAALAESVAEELDFWADSRRDFADRRLGAERVTEIRASVTAARALKRWLEGMRVSEWTNLPSERRRTLLEGTLQPPPELAEDWTRARAAIERAEAACAE